MRAGRYDVDGLGRRVAKWVDDDGNGPDTKQRVMQYFYREGLQLAATVDQGGVITRYVHGGRSDVPAFIQRGTKTYRVIADQLGTPRLIVNISDKNDHLLEADYSAWGVPIGTPTGLDTVPIGFASGLYDPDTGLVRFGARDYDPSIGRWISRDPLDFGGGSPNLYVYVGDDPVNFVDPSGLSKRSTRILSALGNGILQGYGNFYAGVADVLTFGQTGKLLHETGLGRFANECSWAYRYGELSATATLLFAGGVEALEGAGGEALEEAGSSCADGLCENGVCFTRETLVDTEDGKKPISEVKVGDRVWSKNPDTGRTELEPVLRRYVTSGRPIVDVQAIDSNGKLETLRVTPGHRFWVVGHGWTRARALAPGEQLLGENGAPETVLGEAPEGGTQTVYNLEVQSDHTYFVGPLGTWVHDACGPSSPGKMQREVERGWAPKDVDRVDPGHVTGQEPHVHYTDGTASNQSGGIHDASNGVPKPSRAAVRWLLSHGWTPPG